MFKPRLKTLLQLHIRKNAFNLGILKPARQHIFCLSFQRCGTTSFGDFCETNLGMKRSGYIYSFLNDWDRLALDGNFNTIFSSPDFQLNEVFEDNPWWFPNVYKHLYKKFPNAIFVLFERDPDDWFKSLLAHSNGNSPGFTAIHAEVYDRLDEYNSMLASSSSPQSLSWNGLSIKQHKNHYKKIYTQHNEAVKEFFQSKENSHFFYAKLEDEKKFKNFLQFLGKDNVNSDNVWSNRLATENIK